MEKRKMTYLTAASSLDGFLAIESDNPSIRPDTVTRRYPTSVCSSTISPDSYIGTSKLNSGYHFVIVGPDQLEVISDEVVPDQMENEKSKCFHWMSGKAFATPCQGGTLLNISADSLQAVIGGIRSTSISPLSNSISGIEPKREKGIMIMNHKQKVLFSQKIEIDSSELKKWEPEIIIDRRTLQRSNDK